MNVLLIYFDMSLTNLPSKIDVYSQADFEILALMRNATC